MSNVTDIRTGLPVVAGVEIAVDEHGRFNLNAIHRASGGDKKAGPSYWLALDGTKALAEELSKNTEISVIDVKRGRSGGTFVHELLAVAYAAWISPAFHLEVNRVFMDYRTGKLVSKPESSLSRMEILRLAMQSEEERLRLEQQNQEQSDRIEKLENFFKQGMTLAAFGKMLNGVNSNEMKNFAWRELGWLYNESRSGGKRLRVYHAARDKYLTETDVEVGVHGDENIIRYDPKLLKKGAQKLYELYLEGKLPMKKTWDGKFVHMKFEGEAA